MPSDLTVTLAGIIIVVAILGYWFGRSGDAAGRLNWRFREFLDGPPRRSEKAIDAYLREAEKEQQQPEAAFELAAYFRSCGDWRRALRIHESLAARADLAVDARARAGLEIGDDYRSAGMLDRAEEAYARTAEHAPLRLKALRRRLGVCEQLRDWEQAVRITAQLDREEPEAASSLRCHYVCQLAWERAQSGDLKRARKLWKRAARESKACPRPAVDRALMGDEPLGRRLAAAASHPEFAELILAGLSEDGDPESGALDRELSMLLREAPAIGQRLATALLMAPGLLCRSSAACLFSALHESYPAYARTYAAGSPSALALRSLNDLRDELRKVAGGLPRWVCSACGHEDEAHSWRCVECGAWETAHLMSPFAAQR